MMWCTGSGELAIKHLVPLRNGPSHHSSSDYVPINITPSYPLNSLQELARYVLPSLAVRINVPDDKCLLALRCDPHIAGLFTHAWSLLCTFVDPKSLTEDCGDNEFLQHQLQNAGSAWNDHWLILAGSAWNDHNGWVASREASEENARLTERSHLGSK